MIADWAVRQGDTYNIADPDELQQIIVRALAGTNKRSTAVSPSETPADRLRPLNLRQFLSLEIKPREMLLDPILPEKGSAMVYAVRGTGKTHRGARYRFCGRDGNRVPKMEGSETASGAAIDGEMPAAALQERLASIVASAPDVQFDPQNIQILAGDLIENGGIGNLALPDVQAEIDRWLDGVDLLVLDNLSSLTAVIRDNDAESWSPIRNGS